MRGIVAPIRPRRSRCCEYPPSRYSLARSSAPVGGHCLVLLQTLIARLMKLLKRRSVLVEEMGQTYLAEPDDEAAAAPVRASA